MKRLRFYVGTIPCKSDEAVKIRVVPANLGKPSDLDQIRTIFAADRDQAATKYIEQMTGGKAAIRRPPD